MRTAIWLLCLIAAPLRPQGIPQPPSEGFPSELRNYFGLSDDQVRQIVGINETYQSAVGVQEAAIQQLNQQIIAETQKSVLDPVTLGALYVALEQARRDEQAARDQAIGGITRLLTPVQRIRLQALQDALNLRPLVDVAGKENFLLIPVPGPSPAPQAAPKKLRELLPSVAEPKK